jgi:hypothetical protein
MLCCIALLAGKYIYSSVKVFAATGPHLQHQHSLQEANPIPTINALLLLLLFQAALLKPQTQLLPSPSMCQVGEPCYQVAWQGSSMAFVPNELGSAVEVVAEQGRHWP